MRVSWVLAGLVFSATAYAQTTPQAKPTVTVGDFDLWPTLEVRSRGEYRRDPVDMGGAGTGYYTEDPWAVMERTRLGLGAERGALRAQVTFQDARVWGATPPTGIFSNDAFASTGLYEGYIEIHTTTPPGLKPGTDAAPPDSREREPQYIRVGRQAIVWDGGHLVGNADFSPVARTFDAVRGHAGWRSLDFEAFAAIADAPHPIGIGFDDPNGSYYGGTQLYGALASLTLHPLFRAQLYGLLRPAPGQGPSTTTFTPLASDFAQTRTFGDDWTIALGLGGESKGWKYGITGALQLGRVRIFSDELDRLAGAVVADASRRFDGVVLTPTIAIGGSFASGGRSSTQYNQFDPLYPDVQSEHGLLGAFAWSNLIDAHGTVSIVPTQNLRIAADYRYARMVAPSTGEWLDTYLVVAGNAAGTTSPELGHEVDLLVSYRPWPALDVAAGYSLLILGDGAKQMMAAESRGPADFSHYAFIQLTLNVPAKP
ncbi:MAG TPA: alginate export family protein [Polyangiaceae bacterium]